MRITGNMLMAALIISVLCATSCKSDTPWTDDVAEVITGDGGEDGDNQENGSADNQDGEENTGGEDNPGGEDNQGGGGDLPDTGEITTDNPDETVLSGIDPWTGPVASDKAADSKGTDTDIYILGGQYLDQCGDSHLRRSDSHGHQEHTFHSRIR